ncbi:hypothetical protein [Paraglaciecola sp.]|uniref:hypothetical protein n=1 Tax=Paraglaciecola sp. TaxID=1920173 RepID=UPI0030F445BB
MSARYKPYLMLVILLLNQWFAASAVASHVMPMTNKAECNMAMLGSTQEMDMSGSAYRVTEQTSHTMDCCDKDCSCPTSACSSVALLSLNVAKLNINNSFTLVNYQFSSLTVSLSKFQKPPQIV